LPKRSKIFFALQRKAAAWHAFCRHSELAAEIRAKVIHYGGDPAKFQFLDRLYILADKALGRVRQASDEIEELTFGDL